MVDEFPIVRPSGWSSSRAVLALWTTAILLVACGGDGSGTGPDAASGGDGGPDAASGSDGGVDASSGGDSGVDASSGGDGGDDASGPAQDCGAVNENCRITSLADLETRPLCDIFMRYADCISEAGCWRDLGVQNSFRGTCTGFGSFDGELEGGCFCANYPPVREECAAARLSCGTSYGNDSTSMPICSALRNYSTCIADAGCWNDLLTNDAFADTCAAAEGGGSLAGDCTCDEFTSGA